MKTIRAVIEAEQCSKYLVVLCRHFGRKVKSEWNDTHGEVTFPVGRAVMDVDEEAHTLTIVCQADTDDALQKVRAIIDAHVSMFTRRDPIVPDWKPV